jgi:hypothetical protein
VGGVIALLFLDLGARRWVVVSTTPRPLYPRERPGTHCTEGWVVLRAGLVLCENLAPTGIRSPDRPARSQSLYWLSYPAHMLKLRCRAKIIRVKGREKCSACTHWRHVTVLNASGSEICRMPLTTHWQPLTLIFMHSCVMSLSTYYRWNGESNKRGLFNIHVTHSPLYASASHSQSKYSPNIAYKCIQFKYHLLYNHHAVINKPLYYVDIKGQFHAHVVLSW